MSITQEHLSGASSIDGDELTHQLLLENQALLEKLAGRKSARKRIASLRWELFLMVTVFLPFSVLFLGIFGIIDCFHETLAEIREIEKVTK